MTVLEAKDLLEQQLEIHEVFLLLEHLLAKSKMQLFLESNQALSIDQEVKLKGWLERRLEGEPLQHITGWAHFYGLDLRVSKDALIPRPETEVLVEQALADLKKYSQPLVLDVGTGSGAIALALKAECSEARVFASDISEVALELAKRNAERLNLNVMFICSDLLAQPEVNKIARKADLITANLPYLPNTDQAWLSREVKREPELALFSGKDGLDLFRCLEKELYGLMKKGALCWLELDPRNVQQAYKYCSNWSERAVFKDLLDRERFLRLVR